MFVLKSSVWMQWYFWYKIGNKKDYIANYWKNICWPSSEMNSSKWIFSKRCFFQKDIIKVVCRLSLIHADITTINSRKFRPPWEFGAFCKIIIGKYYMDHPWSLAGSDFFIGQLLLCFVSISIRHGPPSTHGNCNCWKVFQITENLQ